MDMSKIEDKKAIDALADIIEYLEPICSDDEVVEAWKEKNKLKVCSKALKNHKDEVIMILATLEGVPVEEYHCNLATLPGELFQIMFNPTLISGFGLQFQKIAVDVFGTAMENTPATETT